MPELFWQWGALRHPEAIVPLGPVPAAGAKTVDSLQYVMVGALCDPVANVPLAALFDLTRCLGPIFTAVARTDPRGTIVVGAASLIAAAGYITPRADNSHPTLPARHVLSMLRTTRSISLSPSGQRRGEAAMRWTAALRCGWALAPPLDSRRPHVASRLGRRLSSGEARQLCAG